MGRTSLKGILCAAFQLSVKSCKEASIHLLYFCFEFIYCFWETILGCAQGLCLWLTVFRVHSWRFIKGPYGKPNTKPRSCVCKTSIIPPLTQVVCARQASSLPFVLYLCIFTPYDLFGDAQGLLLTLYSAITVGSAQETIWI